ncbi:hypothetical protein IQ235_00955 [Oscillatoriales cyanobacterium LEGE 11467]|uniref:Uncharacterized protein n=1 Tax=Zarconia navalis LEGE 11467 TaxID=1828826 RepID=A0A928VS39_9CYAN|nr:hypothetical protein [Zarconia navalis]MBE9039364.1 hypothetical protein [Zarconia navalis LEGE 11467]
MKSLIATTVIATALAGAPLPKWATLPMQIVGATTGLIYLTKSGSPWQHWQEEREREKAIASQQTEFEKWKAGQLKDLQAQAEAVNEQLNADKQAFLEQHKLELDRYADRIDFLQHELASVMRRLDDYEAPQLPEGVEQDAIAARRVIEILDRLGCRCDYRQSWLDSHYIYVRIRPREGGEREIKRHLNRLQLELGLAEPPGIATVPGAIQLYLRPKTMVSLSEAPDFAVTPQFHPEMALANLEASYHMGFVEPETKIQPYGDISQLEKDWLNWLWTRGIRNQKEIISRIWGATSGNGDRFLRARERLRVIAEELGIELRRRDNG